MVMFSGLWKANNHRRNDSDEEEDERKELRKPHCKSASSSHAQKEERRIADDTTDGTVDNDGITSRFLAPPSSSPRKYRRLNNLKPSYVSSVLLGGMWAKSEARRKDDAKDRLSVEFSHNPQYGAVSNENYDPEAGVQGTDDALQQHDNNGYEHESDEESDFPSLTRAFNPGEIDWDVLRMCITYLSAYLLVAVVAYCFVFEKWTVIDALYFAVATFTTVGE